MIDPPKRSLPAKVEILLSTAMRNLVPGIIILFRKGRVFFVELFGCFEKEPYEQLVYAYDQKTNLKAIIAIHDTTLGPALGGTRMWAYTTEEEALNDVLRLSKGMTLKASAAGLNLGGGKAVIIGDSSVDKTENLLKVFGKHIQKLGGNYITAPDVGTNQQDMDVIASMTGHVVGTTGGSGDPSPFTAYGTRQGMRAAVKKLFGKDSLSGLTIAVQGLGNVGCWLCRYLHQDGAKLVVTDINSFAVEKVCREFGAAAVNPAEIYATPCDIFAPSALGAVVNAFTVPQLKCAIIAGAANNVLEKESDGDLLHRQGICYVPDYITNAGGLINVSDQLYGYDKNRVMKKVASIYDTVLEVLAISKEEDVPTYKAAEILAMDRIYKARKEKVGG